MSLTPSNRQYATFFTIFLLGGTFIVYESTNYYSNLNIEEIRKALSLTEDDYSEKIYQVEDSGCNIPKLDPWDPSIMPYIRHYKPLVCDKVQPFLTLIDDDGYLRFNETEVKILKEANLTFSCMYSTFDRKFGSNDNAVEYDKEIQLNKPVKLTKDSVDVKCRYTEDTDVNETLFYWNLHAHPAITEDRLFAEPYDDQLSLLFFVLDSTSYSAFQRNMPLTYNYTKNVMGMKFFTKLSKIGSNSFPNQMAYLIGKRVRDEQYDMLKDIPNEYLKKPLNTWPFIWKHFIAKSYATTINEDWPRYGLFNYGVRGFTKKVVDYYYHNFWLLTEKVRNSKSTAHCISNVPQAKLSLDLTRRHMKTFKDKLQFIYHSLTDSSHSYDNQVEQIETFIMEFWKDLYEGNYLNQTIVLFLSDHGLRMGRIRKTLVGLLEERLPFYGIWFPPWFYAKHPNIEKNIEGNLDRMTTSFDVYETLKDIADANYDGAQRNPKSRGKSQLYPLPINRGCKEAGIADHYCTCIKEDSMNPNDTVAIEGARFAVDQINGLLENISNVCQMVNLSKVDYITHLNFNQKLKQGIESYGDMKEFEEILKNETEAKKVLASKSYMETYLIGFEAEPFNATFEATVKAETKNNKTIWSLDGEIARTSQYAGLSDCIQDKFLRQYCPCFNVTI